MYIIKEEELLREKERVHEQEQMLLRQKEQIAQQQKAIEEQNILIEQRKKSIDSLLLQISKQTEVLNEQNEHLARLREDILFQQTELRQKIAILETQKDSINAQQVLIAEQKSVMAENYARLDDLNIEIEERRKDIEKQKEELGTLAGTIESQRKYMFLMAIVIALVIFIVFYVYRNFKQKKRLSESLTKKNHQIETQSEELKTVNHELIAQRDQLREKNEYIELQNEYITDSIKYATRIQLALLPSIVEIRKTFDSFVFYRPKDIVSGDFYWYMKVPATEGARDKYYMAVVDCTGHGVPGSLLSMIGSRILSETLAENKIFSPSEMLKAMNFSLFRILRHSSSEISDGMDVCLCLIEYHNEQPVVTYAGAKRPLIVYESQTKTVERVRGTGRSIGGFMQVKYKTPFENVIVSLQKGDIIYLTTDGFIDQNNSNRKKYGTPRFTKFIAEIGHKGLEAQEELLKREMDEWQGDEPQRDDMTIMVVKL